MCHSCRKNCLSTQSTCIYLPCFVGFVLRTPAFTSRVLWGSCWEHLHLPPVFCRVRVESTCIYLPCFVGFVLRAPAFTSCVLWGSCWEHLQLPPVFCGVRVALSLTYCLVFCKIIVGLFVQFHLPLYFPSFFYFMDYDYPFGTYNFLLVKDSILHDSTER
jgi:hypothetical protein